MRQTVRVAYEGIKKELEGIPRYDMSWSHRLWLYRNEFASSRGVMYDLTEDRIDDYLTDLEHQRTGKINRGVKEIVENKLIYHLLFSEKYPSCIPDLLATVSTDNDISYVKREHNSMADVLEGLDGQKAVVKPKIASGGSDVHILQRDGNDILFDGESTSELELRERLSKLPESIVVEYVQQADYAEEIYPAGANTIRVLTMVDPQNDEPFIAAAVHRFGTRESGHVDNWSSGGLSAAVNTETGELGKTAASPKGGEFSRGTHHPDTGEEIAGTVVPNWETVREMILEIAGQWRELLPYAGWDVVVTDASGSVKIIEANSTPDVDLMQTHDPLLADERARRFYHHHGVL